MGWMIPRFGECGGCVSLNMISLYIDIYPTYPYVKGDATSKASCLVSMITFGDVIIIL